jgi:putative acyl-CoA dehydrogenase
MSQLEERTTGATHEVFNQSVPLEGYNVFAADRVLVEALEREGGQWAAPRARELGEVCGRPDVLHRGALANENPPKLRTHDRFGNRIDEVEFHPSWHELMRLGVGEGLHALPWREPKPGAHVARGALFMLLTQVEAGVGCPISMTYSVIPALRKQPELADEWEQRFLSLTYDGGLRPAPD